MTPEQLELLIDWVTARTDLTAREVAEQDCDTERWTEGVACGRLRNAFGLHQRADHSGVWGVDGESGPPVPGPSPIASALAAERIRTQRLAHALSALTAAGSGLGDVLATATVGGEKAADTAAMQRLRAAVEFAKRTLIEVNPRGG